MGLGSLIVYQNLDDVLLASPDPHFLSFATHYATFLITSSGLKLSHKSDLTPSKSIVWLGKLISHGTLSNTPSRIAHAIQHLWSLRCRRLSFRGLQRLLGYLQWLLTPSSFCAPFLASSYSLLQQTSLPILLPMSMFRSLLTACFSSSASLTCRPSPPACCMPVMFCDAAPFSGGYIAPLWVESQQTAELYASFCSIRQAALRGLSHVCVVGDTCACVV